ARPAAARPRAADRAMDAAAVAPVSAHPEHLRRAVREARAGSVGGAPRRAREVPARHLPGRGAGVPADAGWLRPAQRLHGRAERALRLRCGALPAPALARVLALLRGPLRSADVPDLRLPLPPRGAARGALDPRGRRHAARAAARVPRRA